MTIWVFVEGVSDRIALEALWERWRNELRIAGWGIRVIPLDNKSNYLRKIGSRAAEKLVHDCGDLVIGLPDFYPNRGYETTRYRHDSLGELVKVQIQLVKQTLSSDFGIPGASIDQLLCRFYATAFKHDAEMLLLAAKEQLRSVLGTQDRLGYWRHPVEDQNQTTPPKRIVEDLFRTRLRRCYRDTIHTKAVLERVQRIDTVVHSDDGQVQCPVFKAMLDWMSARTNIPPV